MEFWVEGHSLAPRWRVFGLRYFLSSRDVGDAGQGSLKVDGGPEVGTGGIYWCNVGLAGRELGLVSLATGPMLAKRRRWSV